MDRGAWWATVHGVAKSQTRLTECAHTQTHTSTPSSGPREVQEGVPRAPGSTLGTGAVVTLSPHLCVLPALTGGIRKRAETATTTFPSSRPLQSSWEAPLSCLFLSVSPDWVHVEKRQNVQGRNGEALAPGREAGNFLGRGGFPGLGRPEVHQH